jgi:hypothetical protein
VDKRSTGPRGVALGRDEAASDQHLSRIFVNIESVPRVDVRVRDNLVREGHQRKQGSSRRNIQLILSHTISNGSYERLPQARGLARARFLRLPIFTGGRSSTKQVSIYICARQPVKYPIVDQLQVLIGELFPKFEHHNCRTGFAHGSNAIATEGVDLVIPMGKAMGTTWITIQSKRTGWAAQAKGLGGLATPAVIASPSAACSAPTPAPLIQRLTRW